jgi:hypothetical protein
LRRGGDERRRSTTRALLSSVSFGIISCRRSVPHVADIAFGFGAAVADLRKLALEMQETGSSATGVATEPG